MISVEQTQTIHLGRTGEQDVTEIVFDIAPWLAQFGQGNVLLNVKRACDTIPYPANIVVVENTAVWTVSKKDVESYGTGKAELTYMVDDKIKKSVIYKTYTEKSLADITPTPENGDTWLDAMTKQVLKAEGHSTQSESYAHGGTGARVDEDTDNAQYYKDQADLDAQATELDRVEVAENKTVVEGLKESVDISEKNVRKDAEQVARDKQDITLIQQDVQTNKDAVDTAKKAVDLAQADVTKKAEQVESDRIRVEQVASDVEKPVREHNVSPVSHADIRDLIEGLTTRLNALADSDDESLDQLSEIVAYIKSNKSLIENVTTNKVNVADIINNLNTNVPNKPLSASMGVELKRLIDLLNKEVVKKVDKTIQQQKDAEQDKVIKKNVEDIFNNYIKPTVKGNPLVLKDSVNFKVLDLEINGSTSQVQTSGKNLFSGDEYNDYVGTLNHIFNGCVDVELNSLPNKIIFSSYLIPKVYKDSNLRIIILDSSKQTLVTLKGNDSIPSDNISKIILDKEEILKKYPTAKAIQFRVRLQDGGSTEKTMICDASKGNEYEPYTGGKPSPSPKYPQEIVNGVINNITWGNGADITFTETIPPIELSKWDKIKKIDGVWKKENNTFIYNVTKINQILSEYENTLRLLVNPNKSLPTDNKQGKSYCNKFQFMFDTEDKEHYFTASSGIIMFINKNRFQTTSVVDINKWFESNDIKFIFKNDTPTYEPLPPETQEVLNNIQTFYPNSTIQTNEGIELNLKYIADTKNYVDGQIAEKVAELNKSIVNTQALALEK